MNRPLLLGHRGTRGSSSVKENTFAAFDQALSQGCDGIEFDVRLTADKVAVICHDARSKQKTIGRASAGELQDLPRLDAVLERYVGRAFLDIEIKEPGLGTLVVAALEKHPAKQGYVISSFLPEVLTELKEAGQSTRLGFIFDRRGDLQRWRELPVQYVIPHYRLVTTQLLNEVHDAGGKLITWTVNDRVTMLRLSSWKVDGIISDRTQLLARTLSAS
jgi:glycerophosphoryl diester phosphodiesterase